MGTLMRALVMPVIYWWADLDWKIRMSISLLLIGISTALYFGDIIWPFGWGVGGALLLFSFPSKYEKNGRQF